VLWVFLKFPASLVHQFLKDSKIASQLTHLFSTLVVKHNRGIPFHEEKRMQSLKRMLENNRDLLAQHAEGRKLIGENDRERVLRQIEMIEKKMDRYSAVDSKNGRAKRMHEERRAKFNEERIRERSL